MSIWSRIADHSNGRITEDDLERAAHRLNSWQVIYAMDHGCRAPYDLITQNLAGFREVFGLLGRDLIHRAHHGYVVCLSRHRVGPRLRLAETRLGVVLRRLYDDKITRADIDNGEIVVDLVELQQAWQEYLGMEWTFRQGELEDLLRALKRYGIVLLRESNQDHPFELVVRSAIEDVFGETVLHQLAAYGAGSESEEGDRETA